jgi:osmotically-inducible protein OsmY
MQKGNKALRGSLNQGKETAVIKNQWKVFAMRAGLIAAIAAWPFAGAIAAGYGDAKGNTVTTEGQPQNKRDEKLMQRVRKSINDEKSLSVDAKNIKVVSVNGKLTLRGPVQSAAERDLITRRASDIAGMENVDDQLKVVAK